MAEHLQWECRCGMSADVVVHHMPFQALTGLYRCRCGRWWFARLAGTGWALVEPTPTRELVAIAEWKRRECGNFWAERAKEKCRG